MTDNEADQPKVKRQVDVGTGMHSDTEINGAMEYTNQDHIKTLVVKQEASETESLQQFDLKNGNSTVVQPGIEKMASFSVSSLESNLVDTSKEIVRQVSLESESKHVQESTESFVQIMRAGVRNHNHQIDFVGNSMESRSNSRIEKSD